MYSPPFYAQKYFYIIPYIQLSVKKRLRKTSLRSLIKFTISLCLVKNLCERRFAVENERLVTL